MRIMMRIKKYIGWTIKKIRKNVRRMPHSQKRLIRMGFVALLIGGILGGWIGRSVEKRATENKVAEAIADVKISEQKKLDAVQKELYDLKEGISQTRDDLPWNLVLVNADNPMQEGYVPELTELDSNVSVDSRIADMARTMLADAKAAGMRIVACSAYRSVARQKQVFSDSMKERVKAGMSYWEAYVDTSASVAVPGTSEHALGLSLDLISNQYTELDERQENTKEAKWLKENCYKYGFILRYPPEKKAITGIIYEPWHYRYVGVEHAKKIMELGITLEEYLQNYYTPEGK